VSAGSGSQPVFYYDLGSPASYLVAEQVNTALPIVPEWEPVLAPSLQAVDRKQVERAAEALALMPVRWPHNWPPDTGEAMLVATYAKRIGRGVAFSLAAFRQAYAAGRDLGDRDTLLIAAAACEMHPTAVLKGITLGSVIDGLEQARERARDAGVGTVPAIEIDGRVFEGDNVLESCTRALEGGA
jgi:2-hydroxychromene-2-carboxylate isomerase